MARETPRDEVWSQTVQVSNKKRKAVFLIEKDSSNKFFCTFVSIPRGSPSCGATGPSQSCWGSFARQIAEGDLAGHLNGVCYGLANANAQGQSSERPVTNLMSGRALVDDPALMLDASEWGGGLIPLSAL